MASVSEITRKQISWRISAYGMNKNTQEIKRKKQSPKWFKQIYLGAIVFQVTIKSVWFVPEKHAIKLYFKHV